MLLGAKGTQGFAQPQHRLRRACKIRVIRRNLQEFLGRLTCASPRRIGFAEKIECLSRQTRFGVFVEERLKAMLGVVVILLLEIAERGVEFLAWRNWLLRTDGLGVGRR